jgi:hypothetical protein
MPMGLPLALASTAFGRMHPALDGRPVSRVGGPPLRALPHIWFDRTSQAALPRTLRIFAMELSTIERLAADLRSIADGTGPTEDELARAPLLLNWRVVARPVLALDGLVLDHPVLGAQQITTSQLYWVSDDKTSARTFSRFYRLSDAA